MEIRRPGETPTLETRAEAEGTVNKQQRYKEIMECLREGDMTAKEIAVMMQKKGYIPTSERNFVSPRLTELGYLGSVEAIGKKKCSYTGKTVAVWSLVR
jgi:repressor of nif and glnA expression